MSYTNCGKYTNDKARIDGKVVIITGSNTGIGLANAHDLAKRGAKLYMACRSGEKGLAAVNEVKEKSGNANIQFMQLDLADLTSIREFSKKFHEIEVRLDILINNAGVLSPLSRTKDGFELNMGVNHLGHFLLTNLLLDLLKKSAPSRVVVVSSDLHRIGSINREDFNSDNHFVGSFRAYGDSKLANLLFMKHLTKVLEGTGVTVNSLCPGAVDTEATRYLNFFMRAIMTPIKKLFYKSTDAGAQTQTMLAVEPELEKVTGKFFVGCKEKEPSAKALDDECAEWLWTKSLDLTGLDSNTSK